MRKSILALAGLALLLCLPGPGRLRAFDGAWVVNTTADDVDPGGCQPDPGDCTLREAIEAANTTTPDLIQFDIPLSDTNCDGTTCTITLASALPTISAPGAVTIDGSSQPDTNPDGPDVVVDGALTHDCFRLESGGNTIKGLVINRCVTGITIAGYVAEDNTISGNYIGINPQGTAALGNTNVGVSIIEGHDNTIGGQTVADRNVISGNGSLGILIMESGANGNMVYGNYIGTNASGTASIGNGFDGIKIAASAQSNHLGGSLTAQRNVISGNAYHGVLIAQTGTDGNVVKGNYIGTDFTGTRALGNAMVGVYVDAGAQDNQIGKDNLIAFNGQDGVRVKGALTTGNTITTNTIHSNGGQGIALIDGGNASLSPPVIGFADCTSVGGSAGLSQNVEVFSDLDGQGRHFECEAQTKPDGTTFFCVSGGPIFRFTRLTATATDASGNTSQFSTPPYPSGCQFGYLPLVMKEY